MTGGDWAALVLASTVGILGMILLSQVRASCRLVTCGLRVHDMMPAMRWLHEMMPIEAPAGTACQALPTTHPRR